MSEPPDTKRYLIGGGAAVCAACCAPPLLALVGIAGAGTAATIATFAVAGLVFALMVAGASILAFTVRRRGRDKASGTGESGHDDRPLPDPVPRRGTPCDRWGVAGLAGVREHRGWVGIGLGIVALGLYGLVATLQPDANFGRLLAAYGGGVFVAGSLAWGMIIDGFRPDRYDITGATVCLIGVAVIMYAPRAA